MKDRHPLLIAAILVVAFGSALSAAPEWEANLTKEPPGNFPALRSVRATYHFGWSGITAGTGDIHVKKTDRQFQFEAAGKTIGFVRALWKLDANFRGSDLAFTNSGVIRTRTEVPASGKT